MNTELLYLKFDKKLEDGSVAYGVAFPSDNEQVILGTYTYEAKRMGGAPTITDTFNFPRCLDNEWKQEGCSEVYVEYGGDKFFVSSVPSSTKDNTSHLYKHEITLTSRREILDNTLFFDVVTEHTATQDKDRYRSNQTKFSFGGDIREFIKRVNDSLVYVGIYDQTKKEGNQGYHLVLKDGYGTDDVKEISIDNQYITEVIQQIYETFNLTYYWRGEVCYVGEYENDLTSDENVLEYGRNDQLLSVAEENTNNKIVDMITGYGSSDNLPYYYPNDDEFGEAVFDVDNIERKQVKSISLNKVMGYQSNFYGLSLLLGKNKNETYESNVFGKSKYIIANNSSKNYEGKGVDATYITPVTYMGELSSQHEFGSSSRLFGENTIWIFFEFNGVAKDKVKLDGLSFVSTEETESALKFGLEFQYENAFYVCEDIDIDTAFGKLSKAIYDRENATDGFGGSGTAKFGEGIDGFINYTKSSDKTHVFTHSTKSVVVIGCKTIATNIEKARGTKRLNKVTTRITGDVIYTHIPESLYYFEYGNRNWVSYEDSGIEFNDIDNIPSKTLEFSFDGENWISSDGNDDNAARVNIKDRIWFEPSQNLLPSIYRNTQGAERFYYATDTPPAGYEDIYKIPGTDKNYTFKNKYVKGNPHQGSVSFDDIKPTINGVRNDVIQEDGLGQLFGEIAGVAFDSADSDVTDSDGNYIHQYFYIKLHKFSGEFGFDLFNHVLASENAVINMIDCQGCPACTFPIKAVWNAEKNKCFNCVSVDENGNLKSLKTDKEDYILSEDAAMDDKLNQNSQEKSIWIAVQKDDSTLGIVMPNAAGDFKPKAGDKFVITGIRPPKVLVTAAEDRLDKALIKYMSENNEDKFNYTIKFSRIFLAEHKDFADKLNENAKICVKFNGIRHELFVSNYSIKRDGNALADVEVELVDSLEVSQSEIKQMIDSVKGDVMNSIGGLNAGGNNGFNASVSDKMYISKLNDDTAQGTITFESLQRFLQGMKVGGQGQYGMDAFGKLIVDLAQSQDYEEETQTGFGFYKRKDGKYGLNISELNVWAKAVFNTLQIRELDYVGGNMVFSPAASKIFTVKEVYDSDGNVTGWKCYLLADNGTTSTINMWHKYDQAKCQTFNIAEGVYENVSNKYYWRLVTDVSRENEELTDAQGNVLYDGQKFAWVILSRRDCENENNDAPAAGDSIVADGNRSDTDRQNLIMIETEGDNAPRFIAYDHVNSYSHTGKDTWVMSPRKFIVKSDFIEITTSSGDKVTMANFRGEWQAGVEYGYYDEVTWMGTRWLCMVAEGMTTTSEPSEDNSEWMATTAIVRRKIIIDLKGQDTLDFGETLDVICSVWLGDKEIDTSEGWSWSVERDSGDKLEDDAWNASPKAKSFNGSIRIAFTASENDLGNEVSGVYGVVFTFKAWQDGNKAMELSATLSV